MKLSIVVLTHNRRAALRECLIRIQANTIETDAEVLVVNNGSQDGTREWLDINAANKNPIPITVIHLADNAGVCSRNHGILAAKGEYIAQVDDDVMVMAGYDRILIEPMERDPQIGATGQEGLYQEQTWGRTPWSAGLIDDRRKPQVGSFCDLLTGYTKAWRNDRARCNPADCATCGGECSVLPWMGDGVYRDGGAPCPECQCSEGPRFLYDERFNPHWGEESDFDMQLRVAGYRLMMVRECVIHRSLKDWKAAMANEGPTAVKYAEEHFQIMKQKWQGDPRLKFEGALVGLRA